MHVISILIVVDALGAVAAGGLQGNVYMVDTNQYLGSWSEGTDQLHTVAQDGQVLSWSVTSVSPSSDVELTGFSGPMVDGGICVPRRQGSIDGSWAGAIQARGQVGAWTYTVALTIDGRQMTFSPFLKVV